MAADPQLLAGVPLFQFLDEHERADLANSVEEIHFPADHIIFNAGDPGDCLYIIHKGEVEIYFKDATGVKIVLETPGPGEFFGELSLLDNGSRTANALARTEISALRVDQQDLDQLFSRHPRAALDVLRAMGRRMRVNTQLLRQTASRNVNSIEEKERSPIEKAADWVAEFSGSITFLGLHLVWFAVWITWNMTVAPAQQFDPFPFGLLTMTVSLEAIILSTLVLLSQARQIEKDKVRADIEYEVNLKAELEIMQLHEKVDRLNEAVLARLAAIERSVSKSI